MGNYLKSIKDYHELDRQHIDKLYTKYKSGDEEAFRQLVQSVLKLVVHIAVNNFSYSNIDHMELISAGNYGAISGVEKFKLNMNTKLSTYCSWWIKSEIKKYIQSYYRITKIPMLERCKKVKRDYNKLGLSISEIAIKYKWKEISVQDYLNSDEYITSICTSIEDTKYTKSQKNKENCEFLEFLLSKLNKLENIVIIHKYGLYGHDVKSRNDIAKLIHGSTERVRQIHKRAILKMRTLE